MYCAPAIWNQKYKVGKQNITSKYDGVGKKPMVGKENSVGRVWENKIAATVGLGNK